MCNKSEVTNSESLFAVGPEAFAVVVRVCEITHGVETWLLSGVEAAMDFCHARFRVPHSEWEVYLIRYDPRSKLKLNGEGVVYYGWQVRLDETERLLIHMDRMMVAL